MLKQFLTDFYAVISFENGGYIDREKFQNFFLESAVLIENKNGVFVQKTVENHLAEFDSAISEYPELFENGFHEVQTEYTVIENETCFLVSSKYKKTYTRNKNAVVESGINNMIIAKWNGQLKIASVLW